MAGSEIQSGVPALLAARIARDLQRSPPRREGARGIGLRLGGLLVASQLLGVAIALGLGARGGSELALVLPALGATATLAAGAFALGREAIPGRGLAVLAWGVAFVLGAATFVALVLLQDRAVLDGQIARAEPGCLALGFVLGLPPLAVGLAAVRRGHAVRPVLAGATMGVLGAVVGLTTLHLHCPNVSWTHVGIVHGAVIVVLGLVGALVGKSALRARAARPS